MIGGQMIDMLAPRARLRRGRGDPAAAAEDRAAVRILLRGRRRSWPRPGANDRDRLRDYARDMGLVFQITDDLLDVTGTAEKTGKAVGKDQDQGKATLVSLYGGRRRPRRSRKLAWRVPPPRLPPYGHAGGRTVRPCRSSCSTGPREVAPMSDICEDEHAARRRSPVPADLRRLRMRRAFGRWPTNCAPS